MVCFSSSKENWVGCVGVCGKTLVCQLKADPGNGMPWEEILTSCVLPEQGMNGYHLSFLLIAFNLFLLFSLGKFVILQSQCWKHDGEDERDKYDKHVQNLEPSPKKEGPAWAKGKNLTFATPNVIFSAWLNKMKQHATQNYSIRSEK